MKKKNKFQRKWKLIRTAPPREKALMAGYVLIVTFTTIAYLKGIGLWP